MEIISHQNRLAKREQGRIIPISGAASWSDSIAAIHNETASFDDALATPDASVGIPAHATSRIICVGLNYMDHAKEGNQAIPDYPVFFIRYFSSFVAHNDALIAPRLSTKYDYEAELAIVIGKRGRHITKGNALSHVLGYTIGMDGSVRDYQKRTPQWMLGKNFDKSGALGPHIITAGALPPGAKGLSVQARINGETLQNGNTADMIFDVPTLIASLTESMTLQPGDIILTGTPAGVGFARRPPVYLKNGDTVEIEIEGIGILKNSVMAEPR